MAGDAVPVCGEDSGTGAELFEIASGLRTLLLHVLEASTGDRRPAGSCLHACILVRSVVGKFTLCRPVIRGGDGEGDGGYRDDAGRMWGHYWIEAADSVGRTWVIDITADQFGGPPVVVAPLPTLRERYLCGDQPLVDSHIVQLGIPGA